MFQLKQVAIVYTRQDKNSLAFNTLSKLLEMSIENRSIFALSNVVTLSIVVSKIFRSDVPCLSISSICSFVSLSRNCRFIVLICISYRSRFVSVDGNLIDRLT
jgi:hypothetical protein